MEDNQTTFFLGLYTVRCSPDKTSFLWLYPNGTIRGLGHKKKKEKKSCFMGRWTFQIGSVGRTFFFFFLIFFFSGGKNDPP